MEIMGMQFTKAIKGSRQDLINQREELIRSEENFILRTASITSKRFISKSDDEWSIALCAFSEAIDTYDEEKGDFRAYAKVVIKRSLIDYFRTQTKYSNEVAISFEALENKSNTNTNNSNPEVEDSPAMESLSVVDKTPVQEEIEAITEELKLFNISFMELTNCSPKQSKTREECKIAVQYILSNCVDKVLNTQQIPIGDIVENTRVSRKTLDRYRKYIIMATIILHGDYPEISEYLKFMKGEQ